METIYNVSVSFGRSYSDVARKFNVCRQSTTNTWKKFVDSREIGLLDKKGAQNSPNLTRTELKIIEIFKQDSRSMLLSKICDVADSYCTVPGGTSKAAISHAIRKRSSMHSN